MEKRNYKRWSESEIGCLQEMTDAKKPLEEIQRTLKGRSLSSIRHKQISLIRSQYPGNTTEPKQDNEAIDVLIELVQSVKTHVAFNGRLLANIKSDTREHEEKTSLIMETLTGTSSTVVAGAKVAADTNRFLRQEHREAERNLALYKESVIRELESIYKLSGTLHDTPVFKLRKKTAEVDNAIGYLLHKLELNQKVN